jgi:hypothetical protein
LKFVAAKHPAGGVVALFFLTFSRDLN